VDYLEFDNNDNNYIAWLESNPTGFVINTTRAKSTEYRVLHTATCRYVKSLQGNSKPGGFTERGYIKICSQDVRSLREWSKNNNGEESGSFSRECSTCKPWDSEGYCSELVVGGPLAKDDIEKLYKKYFDILKFETTELGVKPTEARHLIGRLGEFHCAISVNGEISQVVNQHGFDVISENGSRISVKTTAQKSGFIAISAKTLDKVDKLMVIQYLDGHLNEIYYGDIDKAISKARFYESAARYELDIGKIKELA
jgi:hypothetical protein